MFFVFGSPRSGTTLVSATLSVHPELVVPAETDFIIPLAFVLDRVPDESAGRAIAAQLVTSSVAYDHSLGAYLSREETADIIGRAPYRMADLLKALYAAVAAKAGKRLAGDKSPNDLLFARILEKTGTFASDIKVIHIVRDVRDVMLSLRNVNWAAPGTEQYLARFWSNANLFLNGRLKDRPGQYLLIRYEDLVADPPAGFERICGHLGVRFEPAMLDPARRGRGFENQAHHQNVGRPIEAGRAFGWRRGIDPETRRRCEIQAREALAYFGYEFSAD